MRFWASIALTLLSSPTFADDCLRNQGPVLRILSGSDGGDLVKFSFESRRERFTKLDFGQFRQRAGERILQGKLIRRGILLLSRLGRDIKEIDTPRILPFEPSLTR